MNPFQEKTRGQAIEVDKEGLCVIGIIRRDSNLDRGSVAVTKCRDLSFSCIARLGPYERVGLVRQTRHECIEVATVH